MTQSKVCFLSATLPLRSSARNHTHHPIVCTHRVPTPAHAPPRQAQTLPRRPIGLYEFSRIGIDPTTLLQPSNTPSLFPLITIFFTSSTLLLPLLTSSSYELPISLLAATLLSIWAVDTLLLSSKIQRAVSILLTPSRRIAVHEAGHLVIAHLLGLQVTAYTLPSAWGNEEGVEVKSDGDVYVNAAVGFAGIAAELVVFGACNGGEEDVKAVGRLVKTGGKGKEERKMVIRWGLLNAIVVVKEYKQIVEQVAEEMIKGSAVEQCLSMVDDGMSGLQKSVNS